MHRSIVALFAATASAAVHGLQPGEAPACLATAALAAVPELPEASGLAVSRRTPGRLWAHNDSGEPILFALDARGAVTARLRLGGARVEDWEAVAAGPCPAGSCLYVGDIGDNDAERHRITVYRIPEPAGSERPTDALGVFHATYPDGAHDAEALLVTPDGDLLIVTKGSTGPVALYGFPRELRTGETHALRRVGQPRGREPDEDERVTDGAVSPDGRWVALRTRTSVALHRAADLSAGNWSEVRRIDLKAVGEPQGEGVAIGPDGSLYLAGEGGGQGRPGTLARLACTGLGPG